MMLGRVRQRTDYSKERKMGSTTNHKGGDRTDRRVKKAKGVNRMGAHGFSRGSRAGGARLRRSPKGKAGSRIVKKLLEATHPCRGIC